MTNLVSAFQTAHEKDHDAIATLINTVRAFAMIHREGRYNSDLLEALAVAAEQQIETAQRLSLAHAALMDEKAAAPRLQRFDESELSTAEEIGAGSYLGRGNNV